MTFAGLLFVFAACSAAMGALALTAPPGWWIAPIVLLASLLGSLVVYLVHLDGDYNFIPRLTGACFLFAMLAFAVSRGAPPRVRLRFTLPAAIVGAVAPPAVFIGFLAIACGTGGCVD